MTYYREPIKPTYPSRTYNEYIISNVSEDYGYFRAIIDDIEDQLKNKGLNDLIPIDPSDIEYEYDSCSSWSSCCFKYALECEKPENVWKKELDSYNKEQKKYLSEKNKYEKHLKDKESKKIEKEKRCMKN